VKCPQCSQELESEGGLKRHMTTKHGGYTIDNLKDAGIRPNYKDIARALAGNTSAKDVTDSAPDSEPKIGEGGSEPKTRARRAKVQQEDPDVLAAKERILRARCSRMASLPYTLLSKIMGEESIRLSLEEERDLTESYVTVARAYGWEGTSKLILWGDVMICHAAIVMDPERKGAILKAVGMVGQPESAVEQITDARSEGANEVPIQ
jgi:hypothetical protein